VNGQTAYVFRIAVPILNVRNNEVVGLVGINISIAAVQPMVEQLIKDHDDIGAMALYTGNGTIIGHLVPDRIGKNVVEADAALYEPHLNEAVAAITGENNIHLSVYSPVLKTNLEMAIISFPIGEAGSWTIMLGTPEEEILKPINEMTWFTVFLAAGAILISAVIIFLVSGTITKPIVNVARTLKDISEGEGDLTKSIKLNAKDEVGDLAKYFNATLEKIRTLVITIKRQAASLFDIGNELAANMTETAAAINEITANIQSIKGRVINQSASVTETNATMEQITVNIDKLNGHVESQAASVSQSS
jgi:methyl-accepting chemotaxis protein